MNYNFHQHARSIFLFLEIRKKMPLNWTHSSCDTNNLWRMAELFPCEYPFYQRPPYLLEWAAAKFWIENL